MLSRNNKQITKQTKILKSLITHTIGLMFSLPNKVKNKAYIFSFNSEKRRSLHMFFVFYHIDVIFLDKNKKVVEILENFKPFTIFTSKKDSQFIIECERKTICKNGIKEGIKL